MILFYNNFFRNGYVHEIRFPLYNNDAVDWGGAHSFLRHAFGAFPTAPLALLARLRMILMAAMLSLKWNGAA